MLAPALERLFVLWSQSGQFRQRFLCPLLALSGICPLVYFAGLAREPDSPTTSGRVAEGDGRFE